MREIVDTLMAFSEKNDLWKLSRKMAVKSIDEYLEKNRTNAIFAFSGLSARNFIFSDQSQSLVFYQFDAAVFKLRTILSIARDNSPNLFDVGEYALDVDPTGDIVDETLTFF